MAITLVLVVGSLLAVHTRSAGYRSATTAGWAALAGRVAGASEQTGVRLAALMAKAPTLPNRAFPFSARAVLQQGLDEAVQESAVQASEADRTTPPAPEGGLATSFSQVIDARAVATSRLRSAVDQLLGLAPLPVAGAPATTAPAQPPTLISVGQASAQLTAVGRTYVAADAGYRALEVAAGRRHVAALLPPSAWVSAPAATAPLGPDRLGATAQDLASSTTLAAFHHLVVTAVGLSPPAVASGGVGIVATSCIAPKSTVPGTAPTVLPPTTTVVALVTVTNCGTVPEPDVAVSVTVQGADAGASGGGVTRATAVLAPGSSAAPVLAPLRVVPGHSYTLTVSVALAPGQVDPAGTTHTFLLKIAA